VGIANAYGNKNYLDKMPLNKILEDYVMNDGQINYFGLDFRAKKLDIELLIRKHMVKQITLKEIKDICIALDMEQEYMDFYLLYFAKDDLNESEVQWYWEGVDRTNIDLIIRNTFQGYLDKMVK